MTWLVATVEAGFDTSTGSEAFGHTVGPVPLCGCGTIHLLLYVLQYIAQYICPLLFHSACTWSRLRGWITKQLPAKPSSDNHRVEGKYELLLRLSSLMLDPPLKYQFVPIAPYTGCAQWPSSPQVRFLLTVELGPFQHRS